MSTVHAGARSALIAALRSSLEGEVIDAAHAAYDDARRVWNGMIDRRPAVIARCAHAADVAEAVRIAARYRPPLSIRGGGHQVAGSALCDDGLVIDLSAMRSIDVDAAARLARAGGGATWGELDRATQAFGLATPGGEVSTTGVAGFTLGGGLGMLMRAHGLACDNLRSVEVVAADGSVLTASREEHPDLFWAVRGGGRGIGVVTSFEFELHPLGPDVALAQVVYADEDAEAILRAWPELVRALPDAVTPELLLWTVPPDPQFPAELHDVGVAIAIGIYAGPPGEAASSALEPLKRLATPLLDMSGIAPYVEIQSSFDAVFPAGARYYMKSHFMDSLSDAGVSTLVAWNRRWPGPEKIIALRTLGGAVARVGTSESAFPHRSARFNLSFDAGWADASADSAMIGWARGAWDAMRPFATGGVYVNFSGLDEEADGLRDAVFGATRERLAEVRATYDPDGLFALAAKRP